jgi:excisionase family DNA binding protein
MATRNLQSATPPRRRSQLLTSDEVADRLNTSLRHLKRLREERRIPYFKVGKFVRYDDADVEAWLLAHRVEVMGDAVASSPSDRASRMQMATAR